MSTAIVASRINTDRELRRHHIKAIDFDLWHMDHYDDGHHEVHMLYLGGWTPRGFQGKGDTFTTALDDAIRQLREALPADPPGTYSRNSDGPRIPGVMCSPQMTHS